MEVLGLSECCKELLGLLDDSAMDYRLVGSYTLDSSSWIACWTGQVNEPTYTASSLHAVLVEMLRNERRSEPDVIAKP